MFRITKNDKLINIDFYAQDLFSSNLNFIYGKEILIRAHIESTGELLNTFEIIRYIESDSELTLGLIRSQLEFIQKLDVDVDFKFWINLSGILISNGDLFEKLNYDVLSKVSDSLKERLVLEISENDSDGEVVDVSILCLREKGFKIALDDFGSGYSNLLKLSSFAFDYIKIDLSLIESVPKDLCKTGIYHDIINLCSSTGSLIVVEGIEDNEQLEYVRFLGVDIIQGYLLSKPYKIS